MTHRDGPPWLEDAAKALGLVTPSGNALKLNWSQVLVEIRSLRAERDHYKKLVGGNNLEASDSNGLG